MLYSFNIKEPHHARGHAYAHSSSTGIAFTLLYMLKACATSPQHLLCTLQACAVLLTGIGVKLAIYNPFSSPDAPSQRKLFATSISVCFGLQLVMRPLHSGSLLKHYAPRKLLAAPRRALVVVLRLCTVGAMLGLLGAPLRAPHGRALPPRLLPRPAPLEPHLELQRHRRRPARGRRAQAAPHGQLAQLRRGRQLAIAHQGGGGATEPTQGAAADQAEPIGWRGVDTWTATEAAVAQAWGGPVGSPVLVLVVVAAAAAVV